MKYSLGCIFYCFYFLGFSGIGAGMDIVVSSAKAYVGALNKMLGFQDRKPPKKAEEKIPISA